VYSELFESLPDHPQKTAKETCGVRVVDRIRLALAHLASEPVGLDVTDALIDFACAPDNFRFVKTKGVDIPLADEPVDLAHLDQLMEHLHVDDAEPQVAEIHWVLKLGGRYLCSTPNRVTGPHDISVFFDETAIRLRPLTGSAPESRLREGLLSARDPQLPAGDAALSAGYRTGHAGRAGRSSQRTARQRRHGNDGAGDEMTPTGRRWNPTPRTSWRPHENGYEDRLPAFRRVSLLLATLMMLQHFLANVAPEPLATAWLPYEFGSVAVRSSSPCPAS
jgi:SAM-dependent methyltransferase